MSKKSIRSFTLFSLLVFLFFAPPLSVWVLGTQKNRLAELHFDAGTPSFFLNPIIPMVSLPIKTAQGTPLDTTKFRGKWILLYFNTKPCQQHNCSPYLVNMFQIHNALKKDHLRLIRMWVTTSTLPSELINNKNELVTTSQINDHADLTPNQFYLVDPLGNLILSYKNNTPPEHILIDLQQLMHASQIG